MPKSVWTSREVLRKREQEKFWRWSDGRLAEMGIKKTEAAERIGTTLQSMCAYRRGIKMPLCIMAKLLEILEATDKEIVWAVKCWR